jgi:hypothetical protein
MNKRLRQFEKESKLEIFGLGAKRHIWEAALEKYAELIVQECIGVVEGGHFLHDQAPTAIFARECSGAIKRHFAVEEPKGWICPKCSADRTKTACPLGFGATVDGRCPMTVEAQ